MKTSRKESHRLKVLFLGCILALLAVAGVLAAVFRLDALNGEQYVIKSPTAQVVVTSGTMVKGDVIAEELGLRTGANLDEIDFAAKRAAVLEKIPNLLDIKITRTLPDKIRVVAEERIPLARMNIRGRKVDSGKVVDAAGVVFITQRGTRLLPVIREPLPPGTAVGHALSGRSRAALDLLVACREPDFQELSILEVDTSSPDYLLATLGTNYAKLKIAWSGMDGERTEESKRSLQRQLNHLRSALRANLSNDVRVWNATDFSSPGRIYADTKGHLP